jgi:hypothetical protein
VPGMSCEWRIHAWRRTGRSQHGSDLLVPVPQVSPKGRLTLQSGSGCPLDTAPAVTVAEEPEDYLEDLSVRLTLSERGQREGIPAHKGAPASQPLIMLDEDDPEFDEDEGVDDDLDI